MASRLGSGSVIVVRPGIPDVAPAGLNPLEPAPGFPLQTHADLVRALFTAAFQADEPFPQVLSAALSRCYEELGWDLALGEPLVAGLHPRYPTLTDLARTAEQVVTDIGYGREVRDNVLGFVRVRLTSLRTGTTGRFLEGGHPIDFESLYCNNAVFEIEDVGDDRDKAFLMGAVLIRLAEHLRTRHRTTEVDPGLLHLTVIEEAHRLLRRTDWPGAVAHAVELFADLLAEVRAYGEGLVITEQIPSKLIPDVIKNTAVKVVHRLPAQDDRDAVGATMNLTDSQSRYLVALPPGTGAVFTDGMDFPVLARMPDGTGAETGRPAVTGHPITVVGRRSITCGRDCATDPCTLRQIRAAQRLPEVAPWLAAWAELSVLAHLTGWDMPLPRPDLASQLLHAPARLRDCSISHLVDAAVASRSTAIATTHSPHLLAGHVTHAMRALLAGKSLCGKAEPAWIAAPYRWSLVHDALKAQCVRDPLAAQHPRTAEWEHTHGRTIPGATAAEQLDTVRQWFEVDLSDQATTRVIHWGIGSPAVLERAAGSRRTAPDWKARLDALLNDFGRSWPHRYLQAERPQRKGDTSGDRQTGA